MEIPALLTSISGKKITTSAEWEKWRRPEIMNLLSTYIYGKRPASAEFQLNTRGRIVKEIPHIHGSDVDFYEIEITAGGYSFPVYGYLPSEMPNGPIPAFVFIMNEFCEEMGDVMEDINHPHLPIHRLIEREYALFLVSTKHLYLYQHHHMDFQNGVFEHFCDRNSRRDDDWASISAWAWGASRLMDYLQNFYPVDSDNIAIVGHSRGGKTALWCGATDPRFSLVISNASGCSGAAMHRGKVEGGEMIHHINITDWFCGNYHKYNHNDEMLPCDQHMLIASIAPRLCYVESCVLDEWASPALERLSCRLAGEAYELYGMTGAVLPEESEIQVDTPYHEGSIGYHLQNADHSLNIYDWEQFMDFWEKKRGKK